MIIKSLVSSLVFMICLAIGVRAQAVKNVRQKPKTGKVIIKTITKKEAVVQINEHISDVKFAKLLHENYPVCIDDKDNLLLGAALIKKLEINGVNGGPGIKTLAGLKGFLALEILDVSYTQITELPELPTSLRKLIVWHNQLTSLPVKLPKGLTRLDCSMNEQLSSLPELPANIIEIECFLNNLTSLPVLPKSLTLLNCYGNHLKSLPQLPETLTNLICMNNEITHFPNIPASLATIDCDVDMIDNVPLSSSVIKIKDQAANIRNTSAFKTEPVFPGKVKGNKTEPVVREKVKAIYFIYRAYIYYYDAQREYHPAKFQVLTYIFDVDPTWSFDLVKEKLNNKIVRGLDDPQGTRDNEFIYPCKGDCNKIYEERSKDVRNEHANALIEPIRYITIE